MTTLALAARLARSGGRLRTGSMLAGNAIGALLALLVLAIPGAASGAQALTADTRSLVRVVMVFLLLPVGILLLSIGRLASGVRDRRLAGLRLLGVSPGRTRAIAASENGITAGAGALTGAALAVPVAAWISPRLIERGWVTTDLAVPLGRATLVALGVTALSMLVSLGPTRGLTERALGVRRGLPRRPSPWRVVPMAIGVALLLFVRWYAPVTDFSRLSAEQFSLVLLAGIGLTGLSIPIALPVVVRLAADLLARSAPTPAALLAGRSLQAAPVASSRLVAGLATALFLVTGSFGVLAAFQSVGQYARPAHAIEVGPQRHQLTFFDAGAAPEQLKMVAERLAAVDGVRLVLASYQLVARDSNPDNYGEVFVGTCAQLAQSVVVPQCQDGQAGVIRDSVNDFGRFDPATVVLTRGESTDDSDAAGAPGLGNVAQWQADSAATRELFPDASFPVLIVPPDLPGLAAFAGDPTAYDIISDGGFAVRDRLAAAAREAGITVHGLAKDDWLAASDANSMLMRLQDLEDYDVTNGYAVLLWTLAAIVLGIGAVSVLLSAIDHAIARRREIAGQLVLGAPGRVMRAGQALEVLVALLLAQLAAIALGYLALRAYLDFTGDGAHLPAGGVLAMAASAIAVALVVAGVSMLGVTRQLTPELLRRE